MFPIFATASASEEMARWIWKFSLGCYVVALLLALVALGGCFVKGYRGSLGLALLGGLISLIPVTFAVYVHHIDFVEVGADGTPASEPLWKALAVPLFPLVGSLLAAVITFRKAHRPLMD